MANGDQDYRTAKANYRAVYGTPTVIGVDTERYGSILQMGRIELYPERTQDDALNMANLAQRVTQLERELAELKRTWEGEL